MVESAFKAVRAMADGEQTPLEAVSYTHLYYNKGNTEQFPPDGLSTAPAAAARHLRCKNAR